jgi:phosphotriesterase-related protein
MHRRDFLRLSGALVAAGLPVERAFPHEAGATRLPASDGRMMTVLGPIAPAAFGSALCHEHVLVDFVGADRVSPGRYDANEAYAIALPHLRRAYDLGCRGFVECTPAYLGRDVRLLERLARGTGLHILTNTGYYGAANDEYVPRHARDESADRLAGRWIAEWERGIDGTDIRPGFIKTGVDAGPLSDLDRKLVQAAARTHAKTGLTIASHTGDTRAALDQLQLLAAERVPPAAFVWVHAQSDWQPDARVKAARLGAWIEIDNVAPGTVGECTRRVTTLKDRGILDRLLVSHDAGWYRPGEPRGGEFRGFETLYGAFVPALAAAGWTEAEVRQLLVANPACAFAVTRDR